MKSRTMGAHRTMGGSLSSTLYTSGTCASIGSRCGTMVVSVKQSRSAVIVVLIIVGFIIIVCMRMITFQPLKILLYLSVLRSLEDFSNFGFGV